MNIFFLDRDPERAARWLADKHVRKMGLEAVQMLSRPYNAPGSAHAPPPRLDGTPYRGGYPRHPATLWVCESMDHWEWLARHAAAIFDEYERRFGAPSRPREALAYMRARPPLWLPPGWRDPPQCMPDDYKRACAVEAYRAYYGGAKAHLHRWTAAEPPPWLAAPA